MSEEAEAAKAAKTAAEAAAEFAKTAAATATTMAEAITVAAKAITAVAEAITAPKTAAAEDPIAKRNRLSAAHFANYQEYNKVLRTWFVTFGLGAPSLFLVNANLGARLDRNPAHTTIIICYLVGCLIQVVIAVVNKFVAWHNYDDQQTDTFRKTMRHKLCQKLENEFRIDMAADIGTAALFIFATFKVMNIFD